MQDTSFVHSKNYEADDKKRDQLSPL